MLPKNDLRKAEGIEEIDLELIEIYDADTNVKNNAENTTKDDEVEFEKVEFDSAPWIRDSESDIDSD